MTRTLSIVRPRLTGRLTTALLSLAVLHAEAAPVPLVNPDFETGSDGDSSRSPIAGWVDSGSSAGFWLQDGSGEGSFPQDPSEANSGVLYLSANRLAGAASNQPTESTLSQTASVDAGDLASIRAGDTHLEVSFHYHDTDDSDTGEVSVDFLDSDGTLISGESGGKLPNISPNGTPYHATGSPWTPNTFSVAVPATTEAIRIVIRTTRTAASATNVHFDNFAATIVPAPPPLVSDYRSTRPWSAYDGGARTPVPAGSYFQIPFMAVTDAPTPGALRIAGQGLAAPIHHSPGDAAVVGIAANALATDIERVAGIAPAVSNGAPAGSEAILIGTIGSSPLIDGLVESNVIDVSEIEGKWEAYTAVVVENPLPGLSRALVIAGSDRRGTAFGTFALSESIGVSPWHFWGDVPTPQRSGLHVAGSHTQGSPGVKYRGIFLNDEDWGLQPWAAETFEPEVGNIGPKTYATIFELLLRLHANVVWPAMHEFPVETTPFYLVPGNKEAADDHAIIISTSHHEPMLRNSHEYDESVLGPYNYWTNRSNIYGFWEERVRETAGTEIIHTIGMRGRTDAGMLAPAGTGNAEKARKIQDEIIPDQRRMISDHVNEDPSEIPQIFIPYKETLVQYQAGLQLPDDVTILWPDDNHGYIRQLSNADERARAGGSGVYYHLSYWGVPSSYLWFCTTPPGMTRSEMMKAWDFGANKIWLVNVGDLKPHEIGTDFFLRLARDPEAFREFDQDEYLTQWATKHFGPTHASDIANVLGDYFRLNIVKRPEHLSRSNSGFSLIENGDESAGRLQTFERTTAEAEAIYDQLPSASKPAFYEMVLFGIRASHQVNRRNLQAERSRLWAEQGRAGTIEPAAEAQAAQAALLSELAFYNETNAGGKWNGMLGPDLQASGWWRETQNPFLMPEVGSHAPQSAAGLGVAIEGMGTPLSENVSGELPVFTRTADPTRFIDVFNRGTNAMAWSATTSDPWIILDTTGGDRDARIVVGIDWTKAPRGHSVPGTITITGAGSRHTVGLHIFHPLELNIATLPDALEENGLVEIEAEDFTSREDLGDGTGWRRQDQAAASDDGMTILPVTVDSLDPANLPEDAPSLTYRFHAFSTGRARIRIQCLPTHRITSDHPGVRYAVSLNGDTPRIVDVNAPEYSSAWNTNTLRAASIGISQHEITSPGPQTIVVRMVDAGVVLDRITVEISSGEFEAEDLEVSATDTSAVIFTDPPASGGAGLHIRSTSSDRYATLALPNVPAGDYRLTVRTKKWNSRGIVRIAVSDNPLGPFTEIGEPYDLYSDYESYEDLGPLDVSFGSAGTKYLRFTTVGKNPESSNYWVLIDRITLRRSTHLGGGDIAGWRTVFFGDPDNAGPAADLADPDGDRIPNLIEYATGTYPTVPDTAPVSAVPGGEHLKLSFNRARDATDVTYRVFAGTDLPPTTAVWSSLGIPYPGGDEPLCPVTVEDVVPIASSPHRFMTLEITRQ